MACNTISDANPDIAGIGIILAFGLQALISLLLSTTARILLSKHFPLVRRERKSFWNELLGISATDTDDEPLTREYFLRFSFGPGTARIWTNVRHAIEAVDTSDMQSSKAKQLATALIESIKKSITDEVGGAAELSSLLFPSGNGTSNNDSLHLSPIMNSASQEIEKKEARRSRIRSQFSEEITRSQEKIQELICRVLLVASDSQTVTGIALIITAMIQQKSLSLYHLHIIYDIINFTTVSNIAAISCVYDNHLESQRVRYFSISVFGLLYFGFTIMLGIRLNDWNDDIPGRCYRTSNIATPHAKHPLVDQVYLGVTSLYVFSLMFSGLVSCRVPNKILRWHMQLILVSVLQFILHVYILVALRTANQPLLDNAALEDQWGFAQVIAIMMLVATLLECARSGEEYFSWKKEEAVRLREKAELENKQALLFRSKTFP